MGRPLNSDDPQLLNTLFKDAIKSIANNKEEQLLRTNLFSYCGNNPVMNIDSDGQWFWIVVGAVSGGYIGYKIGNKLRLYGWKLAVVTAIGAGIGAALGFTTDCWVTIFQL